MHIKTERRGEKWKLRRKWILILAAAGADDVTTCAHDQVSKTACVLQRNCSQGITRHERPEARQFTEKPQTHADSAQLRALFSFESSLKTSARQINTAPGINEWHLLLAKSTGLWKGSRDWAVTKMCAANTDSRWIWRCAGEGLVNEADPLLF